MSKGSPSLPLTGHAPADQYVEGDVEMLDVSQDEHEDEEMPEARGTPSSSLQETRPPRETRKDKDLTTFLKSMDKYAPIVYMLNA
jgi:hypothetical protein